MPIIQPPTLINFNPPMQGTTRHAHRFGRVGDISIHASLAGSDALVAPALVQAFKFQSTLPLRGATGGRDQRSSLM